jgi:hypothetical protein
MSKAKQYTPAGDLITVHEHKWVQSSITLHPGPTPARPTVGCTVLWRCTRPGCIALYEKPYQFRKPSIKTQGNTFSRPVKLT